MGVEAEEVEAPLLPALPTTKRTGRRQDLIIMVKINLRFLVIRTRDLMFKLPSNGGKGIKRLMEAVS